MKTERPRKKAIDSVNLSLIFRACISFQWQLLIYNNYLEDSTAMSYLSAGFEPLPQTVFLCSQLVQCDQMLELNVAQKV